MKDGHLKVVTETDNIDMSRYDIKSWTGLKLSLKMEPHPQGILVQYVDDELHKKVSENPMFRMFAGNAEIIFQELVTLKWWEKIVQKDLSKKAEKRILKFKNKFEKIDRLQEKNSFAIKKITGVRRGINETTNNQ